MSFKTLVKVSSVLLLGMLFACSTPKKQQVVKNNNAEQQQNQAQEANNTDQLTKYATVYFNFDKSQPIAEEMYKIKAQAKWIKSNDVKMITIQGNTDIYGTREYNLALGERRANAVKELLEKYGVSANKIRVISYGKEQLASTTDQAKNRRTFTVVELNKNPNENLYNKAQPQDDGSY